MNAHFDLCDRCGGKGWLKVDDEPTFCDCERGKRMFKSFVAGLAARRRRDYKAEAGGEK